MCYYAIIYVKSGNLWVAKYLNEGYLSWKLLDDTDFMSSGDPKDRYEECCNEEYSLGYPCSKSEFFANVW